MSTPALFLVADVLWLPILVLAGAIAERRTAMR